MTLNPNTDSARDEPGPGVIESAFGLLEILRALGRAWSTDLTEESGLPRTTVSRLLGQLVAVDAVDRVGAHYRLGPGLLALGQNVTPMERALSRPSGCPAARRPPSASSCRLAGFRGSCSARSASPLNASPRWSHYTARRARARTDHARLATVIRSTALGRSACSRRVCARARCSESRTRRQPGAPTTLAPGASASRRSPHPRPFGTFPPGGTSCATRR